MVSKSKRKVKKKGTVRGKTAQGAPLPAWDKSIDEDELTRPGGALLAMLYGRARQLGHTRGELAKHLNVTYGYIAQLSAGHRRTEHISDDFATACARYLGVPKITVLLASGAITPVDLFEQPDEIALALPMALEHLQVDPVFGPLVPQELMAKNTSVRIQFLVVRLFEAARGLKLIPGEHTLESIAQSIKAIEDRRRQLLKKASK